MHIREFGCYDAYCDDESRVNYYRPFREIADKLGLGWAVWDWKAEFHYWKETGGSGTPDPIGLRNGLFPRPRPESQFPGKVEFEGAVGKSHAIYRRPDWDSGGAWDIVGTQTLTMPRLKFTEPVAGQQPAAFYRVEWLKRP